VYIVIKLQVYKTRQQGMGRNCLMDIGFPLGMMEMF